MASKNTKLMHEQFGRNAVVTHDPDSSWPLPSELIGIEIEVEELQLTSAMRSSIQQFWTTHSDGSLRDGTEFVLAAPTGGRQLTQAIDAFFDSGVRYVTNPRTSIHVHINSSDNMTVDHFRNMFTLMYLIEPAVFRWADENRKWCGYCQPLTDLAPARIINIMNDARDSGRFVRAVRGDANHDRYYGFNVAAYHRHGTVEFRYFPCTTEKQRMIEWVKFCMYVKKAARRHDSPEDILNLLNTENGVISFINEWFGDVASSLLRNLDMADCLQRVKEMRTMVNVDPATLKDPMNGYRSVRSRGFQRYLTRNFPDMAAAAASGADENASPTASDLYTQLTRRSVETPSAVRSVTRAAVDEARIAYEQANTTYGLNPTSMNRRMMEAAMRVYVELSNTYSRQSF